MNSENVKKVKLLAIILVVGFAVWFLFISPSLNFRKNEKVVEDAARRYFELNSSKLPTGDRISTVSLLELSHKSYLKNDVYIAYSKKPCSLDDSWVKVKKVDGEYKYFVNLKCGLKSSHIDSKGPVIKLNGDENVTLEIGSKFKDPGVKSVVDNKDGKIDVKKVIIKDSNLNTNKIGKYTIEYIAFDSLKNKSVVTRNINVISTLKSKIKKDTNGKNVYTGLNPNNFIYFSNMLYRIVDLKGDKVRIVAANDISNVNYDGIDKWLDYYYDHFTDKSKEMIVKNKYCDMNIESDPSSITECTSYTKDRNIYIPSVVDINTARTTEGSFMETKTISWTANGHDKENAYVVRNEFFQEYYLHDFIYDKKINNYGVRPIITIKSDLVIKSGDGTFKNPFSVGDTTVAKADEKINARNTGEYVLYSGMKWRIIESNKDGTTKVISDTVLYSDGKNVKTSYLIDNKSKTRIYNPNEKGNIGYFIKNNASRYLNTSYFANREVIVPIYKKDILYGKEVDTKKYKSKLAAPNVYDIFSAFTYDYNSNLSYWLINSSKSEFYKTIMSDIGVVITNPIYDFNERGIRLVANFDKSVMVVKGYGTYDSPYVITK